jgi:hypothetical protein
MKNDQWTTKEALPDLREATRLDLIFLQGCGEDWKRQPFGTALIRTPTVSGGCDDDVPADDGGSGGGAAADADADAGTPGRDPASDAGESGGGAATAGGGGGGGDESEGGAAAEAAGPPAWQHCQKEGPPPPPRRGRPFLFSLIKIHDSLTYTSRF